MSYAKVDDLYDDRRKIKRAWRAFPPNPVGLHAMAITYCQRHKLDGRVPDDWIEELLPAKRLRDQILSGMVEFKLFDFAPHEDGNYVVHDFLDYNESAAERKRRSEQAKEAARERWAHASSNA